MTISLAVIPDIISEDVESVLKTYLGSNYKFIIVFIFIMGTGVLTYLNTDKNKSLKSKQKYKIDWNKENLLHIKRAKKLAKFGDLKNSIEELIKFKNHALKKEADLLLSTLSFVESNKNSQEYLKFRSDIAHKVLLLISDIEDSQIPVYKHLNSVNLYLRDKYKERLTQKINGKKPIKANLVIKSLNDDDDFNESDIYNVFEYYNERLLILGSPGVGKSVIMLQLAIKILEYSNNIPIILKLSSWDIKYDSIEQWVSALLSPELNISKITSQEILKWYPIVLLLDGFDEIKEEAKEDFFQKLSIYGTNIHNKFIVSSRNEPYKKSIKKAPIYTQILVNYLEFDQIEKELNQIGTSQPEVPVLLSTIKKYTILKEVIKTPFYFNLLQSILSKGKSINELGIDFSGNSIKEVKKRIVDIYFELSFKKADIDIQFIKYIAIKTSSLSYFELSSIDYDWVDENGNKNRWHGFISMTVRVFPLIPLITISYTFLSNVSLIYEFITQDKLIIKYFKTIINRSISNLPYITIFLISLFFIIIYTSKRESVRVFTKETFGFSIKNVLLLFKKNILQRLIFTISIGIILFFYSNNFKLSIIASVAVFLLNTINNIIFSTLEENEEKEALKLIKIKKPYQRFYISMRFLHFSIIEHFYVRLVLWKKGKLPFELVPFLKKMTDLGILESDGASWTFRHKILQDYLINYDESNIND